MSRIMIGGIEFDRECPEACPGHKESMVQGGLCHRCPIFNCVSFGGGDDFCLIEPEDYRSDWAEAWRGWFDDGMKGFPYLPLSVKDRR
jgi:hypothetical protein